MVKTALQINWRTKLNQLRKAYIKRLDYQRYLQLGAEEMKIRPYSDATGDSFAVSILDWIKYNGDSGIILSRDRSNDIVVIRAFVGRNRFIILAKPGRDGRNSHPTFNGTSARDGFTQVHFANMIQFISWYKNL